MSDKNAGIGRDAEIFQQTGSRSEDGGRGCYVSGVKCAVSG